MGLSRHRRRQRGGVLGAWAAAAVAALSAPAIAQLGQLDAGVVRSITLTDDQKKQISDFLAPHAQKLGDADVGVIRSARSAIVKLLDDPQISAAARLEFSRDLEPTLAKLVGDSRDVVAINAIVIAGELATADAMKVVDVGSGSKSTSVRYQAAYALGRTFEAIQNSSAEAIRQEAASELARRLQARLKDESDPSVIGALARAGLAAGGVNKQGFAELRHTAYGALCAGLVGRADVKGAKLLPGEAADAYLAVCLGLRDAIAGGDAGGLPQDTVRRASEFAGEVLAHCGRVVSAGELKAAVDPMSREVYAQLSQAAETLLAAAARSLAANVQFPEKGLGPKLRKNVAAADAQFVVDVGEIVGPTGTLTKDPFNFPPNRFPIK